MVTLMIGLILAFIIGFVVALVCVRVGLKWNMQMANKQEPTLNINPIAPIVDAVQQNKADKANKYSTEQLKEWMFGDGSKS